MGGAAIMGAGMLANKARNRNAALKPNTNAKADGGSTRGGFGSSGEASGHGSSG